MRKVSYVVNGNTFTSYRKALAFKEQCEAVFGYTFDIETVLEEISTFREEKKNG